MNKSSLIPALVLAGAAFGSQAFAADTSTAPQALDLTTGSTMLTTLYTGNNKGNTFSDHYTFTAAPSGTLSASLESSSGLAQLGLDITAFALYGSGGLVQAGTQLSTGVLDQWSLTTANLAADNYYLVVSGNVVGQAAGKYDLNVGVAPVPEPETYGMMLGGLGLLGFMARRRNKRIAAA